MAKAAEILRDHLGEHPAVRAWSAIAPERVEPETIAVIKSWGRRYRSGVYRLEGVRPGGSAVIAKRCPGGPARLERSIYEELLPHLSLPTLDYYGSVDEPDGQSCWLFLEDAGGELYSPQNPEHRALAARWLAALHNTGRRLGWDTRLPDRGPEQYLRLLQFCRANLREQLDNPYLPPDGAAVLDVVFAQYDSLEAHWNEIQNVCQSVPRTLLHGDFVIKNLRVRQSADGPELLVFDWEFAGWGSPGTDLVQFTGRVASPDLAVYRSRVEGWPSDLNDGHAQRLAECGRFFRVVDTMYWTCIGLTAAPPKYLATAILQLKTYSQRMAQALSEAGWATA